MKKKIITILGTRPEIIRLSSIIKQLDKNFNHIMINTNQNYDKNLNEVFFNQFKIKKPKYVLKKEKFNSPIEFISRAMLRVDNILKIEKPDGVLVLGDTNTSLMSIVAKKRKIPIFHIEAGNRCFDERVPEEINRKIVDHISDINLTYSEFARQNLISEGLNQDRIIKVGSPLYEVYNNNNLLIEKSRILKKLNLRKKNFFLASIHREENVDDISNLDKIIKSLNMIVKKFKMPLIVSTHPRTKSKLKYLNKIDSKIKFMSPFGFFDYVKLIRNCILILSDSGSITEETSILKIPSINLRNTFERQEGYEKGLSIISGLNSNDILESIHLILNKSFFDSHEDYCVSNVSENVCNIIQSHIHYINYKVWYR